MVEKKTCFFPIHFLYFQGKQCYHFRDFLYVPAKITDAVRNRAIEKNKFFMEAILPYYKRVFNLTDPLFATYFAKTKVPNGFIDYFKVTFSAKFYILLEKRTTDKYQFFRAKSGGTSKTATSNPFCSTALCFLN